MTEDRPSREEDSKVVVSKLPRDEFVNFKKVCDWENKTPNKKIRELIKLEVDKKLGDIYRPNYDLEKIKFFQKRTLENYNNNIIIDKLCKISLVDKTDKNFIQIGMRPLIDEDIFLPKGTVHPELPSLGRIIANGEEEFLIKSILDNQDIEKIEFNEDIKEFPKYVFVFDNAVILLSTKFYVEVFTKLMNRIDYEEKCPRLDGRYKIISVPEKILGNKIVIIDKNAILWEKQKFYNAFTEKDETLDIKIEPRTDWKVDITARSVNKIKCIDPELIKILEVEKSDGKKNKFLGN